MTSSINTVQYVCDQAGLGSRVTFKKMFGEYALYLDGKVVAFICDDQLFLKPTVEGKSYLGSVTEAPPYPGAKKYFLISSELDDQERLRVVLRITAQALPESKAKSKSAAKRGVSPPGVTRTAKKHKSPN